MNTNESSFFLTALSKSSIFPFNLAEKKQLSTQFDIKNQEIFPHVQWRLLQLPFIQEFII